jgi:hypothetical protein
MFGRAVKTFFECYSIRQPAGTEKKQLNQSKIWQIIISVLPTFPTPVPGAVKFFTVVIYRFS